jgi:hypothetical protein
LQIYNSGNGYCKWGDNCKHSHRGKKGGKRKANSTVILSSKDKKAKKKLAKEKMMKNSTIWSEDGKVP